MYAAIMAGGSGTRLWPKSRKNCPKQLHVLSGDQTLIQQTVGRLAGVVDNDSIYVIAHQTHLAPIREQLPWLTEGQLVGEPHARNTAPAVGVIAALIGHRDPDAVFVVLPSDHMITREDKFRSVLEAAGQIAAEGPNVVTIGIRPTGAETGYGYIEMADDMRSIGDVAVHSVAAFKEKPNAKQAEEYVSSWKYLWNSGVFVWSARTVMDLYRDHAPEIYKLLLRFQDAIGTADEDRVFHEIYDAFPSISVDYAIIEHASNIKVITSTFGWSDLGSWSSLYDITGTDADKNAVIGEHVGVDTYGCLIHSSGKLIATVGLDNMIVVDDGDVLLIMPAGRAQDVKTLLDEIKKRGLGKYL